MHISTDKAAMATTTMGQTKSLAEKLIINSGINTGYIPIKFSAVRFGNILASRGSVIEKFIYQIKNKMSLTVTDKNMIRYFMTINVATEMILSAISIAKGSEVFIFKNIGKFKIIDLANALMKYFKVRNKIKFTHKQDGEKIEEKFVSNDEITFLKEIKNMYILDFVNRYNIKKVKKIKLNEKILNKDEIIKLLKKENVI